MVSTVFSSPDGHCSIRLKSRIAGFIMGVAVAVSTVHADEVRLPYKDLTLNANLELAAGKRHQ